MTKRKAEETPERPMHLIPPVPPQLIQTSPNGNLQQLPFHPPMTAAELANCRIGLCQYCHWLSDIKLKYELIYGTQAAPPRREMSRRLRLSEEDEVEPTIRQDNAAFDRILELEAANRALKKEKKALRKAVKGLRKDKKHRLIAELAEEDREATADIDADDEVGIPLEKLNKTGSVNGRLERNGSKDVTTMANKNTPDGSSDDDIPLVPSGKRQPKLPDARTKKTHATGPSPPPQQLKEVFAVHFVYEDGRWPMICGIYSDLAAANAAAWEVFKLHFDFWADVETHGKTRRDGTLDFGALTESGIGQRRCRRTGEVSYTVELVPPRSLGPNDTGHVAAVEVQRHQLDVSMKTR